jgi:hypothetical protein
LLVRIGGSGEPSFEIEGDLERDLEGVRERERDLEGLRELGRDAGLEVEFGIVTVPPSCFWTTKAS